MSRSVFGWDLPPGVTNKMIDEAYGQEGPCPVCCKSVDLCLCPECTTCGEQGNPRCYKDHGLKLNKEQAVARQEARLVVIRERLSDEEIALEQMKGEDPKEHYDIDDIPDPYG